MDSRVFGLILAAVSAFGISEVLATNEIIFDVNKGSYGPGDLVELTGKVKDSPNQLVAIEVKDTDGNTIVIRTVQTDSDGNFVLKFKMPSSVKAGKLNIVANAKVNGASVTQTKIVQSTSQPLTQQTPTSSNKGGGCLVATATYGSELAPQVQQLRETRDKILLHTQSGTSFMTAFNQFYYTFSPTIADWERENPIFKETVKLSITPMITILSILSYIPIHSEAEMLGYGIGVILLNIGIYFVAPAVVIIKLRHKF